MVSLLSLLHRAVPESGLDPWLIDARQRLPAPVRDELDLLHGFSGRLLYYPEEPVMRFQPLRDDHRQATIDDLLDFMEAVPAEEYLAMVAHALQRVYYADLERRWQPPTDLESWARALKPALTAATLDEVLPLISDPESLKWRTIALYRNVWDAVYRTARDAELPTLLAAAQQGSRFSDREFAQAFASLTGQRVPGVLDSPPPTITRITFCPSAHLGRFVSYIAYQPDLIVYFSAPHFLDRHRETEPIPAAIPARAPIETADQGALLEASRALADPTRLRMIDLLLDGELYAQEIVGRLGVAQSAASRHLAQLERAGLVSVEARRGSKYYAVNPDKLEAIAAWLLDRGSRARERQ